MSSLARGLTSVGVANVVEKLLGVVKLVVVSRVLGPSEFGLYGLALVVILTVEQFTQVGFESALISKREVRAEDKSTAWFLMIARGVLLGAVIWSSAPLISRFFGEPEVQHLIRWMAVGVMIQSAQSVGVYVARREMRFTPWLWMRVVGSIVDLAVSVLLAFVWGTALALVIGYVASVCARTAVGYLLAPYRPEWCITRASAVHLFRFGRWATGLSIVLFSLTQGDDLLVAKLLGVGALGLYQMGYRVSNMPTSEVTHVLSNFTLPFYARLRNDGDDVGSAFRSVIAITGLIAIPVAVLVVFFARPFVSVVLGADWVEVVPIIQVLVVWGVTRSLDATAGALFFALGRPDLDFKLHAAKLLVLALLIVPGLRVAGLAGVAVAVAITGVALAPVTMRSAAKLLERGAGHLYGGLAGALAVGCAVTGIAFTIRSLGLRDVSELVGGLVLALSVAAGVVYGARRGALPAATSFFRMIGVRG